MIPHLYRIYSRVVQFRVCALLLPRSNLWCVFPLWCDFSTFIIRDRGRVFSESRFIFSRVVLSASLQYLLDHLPVVFSGSQWPLVTATDF
jgi:hypothetical protein